MRELIRSIRQRYHPLFRLRQKPLGRLLIRLVDRTVWLPIRGINFRVRGRILTHGVAFSLVGSQETNPEALMRVCIKQFRIRSFWDIGSNIGFYAWMVKSVLPEAELIMIEPLAANAELIRATLRRQGLPATTLIEAGASDHTGEAILRADQLSGATSTMECGIETFEERHMGIPAEEHRISVVSVDDLSLRRGPVDLMKIDVEGHEASVLRGASQTLARDQPIVFIECAHQGHKCLDRLKSLGYSIVDADRLRWECSGDSTNFFCFPPQYLASVDAILRSARGQTH